MQCDAGFSLDARKAIFVTMWYHMYIIWCWGCWLWLMHSSQCLMAYASQRRRFRPGCPKGNISDAGFDLVPERQKSMVSWWDPHALYPRVWVALSYIYICSWWWLLVWLSVVLWFVVVCRSMANCDVPVYGCVCICVGVMPEWMHMRCCAWVALYLVLCFSDVLICLCADVTNWWCDLM